MNPVPGFLTRPKRTLARLDPNLGAGNMTLVWPTYVSTLEVSYRYVTTSGDGAPGTKLREGCYSDFGSRLL